MLGLGSNLTKVNRLVLSPVTDSLVLKHDYQLRPVRPLSDGAAYFVESNTDYISVSDAASLSFDACSFSAWIFVTDATDFPIIGKGVYNSTAEYQLKVQSDDKIHFWVADESVASCHIGRSTPTITSYENQWIHVAGTYDGGTVSSGLKIYINGVQVDSANDEANAGSFVAMENLGADVEIGKYSSTYGDGYICNVGIWDAVLSQAQIKSIMWKDYAGLSDSEETNLVSWWNLDSVIDSADSGDGDTTVYDNHHGGGDTLGSELITNGTFDTDASNWVDDSQATLTWQSDQTLKVQTTDDGTYAAKQTSFLTSGKTYKISFRYYPDANGAFRARAGGSSVQWSTASAVGGEWNTAEFYATADGPSLEIGATSGIDYFYLDDVSVKLVNGNTGTLG